MKDDELVEAMARGTFDDEWERALNSENEHTRTATMESDKEECWGIWKRKYTQQARAALRIARPAILEEAAKAVDHCICDAAEDAEAFMRLRDYFAAAIRALIPSAPSES